MRPNLSPPSSNQRDYRRLPKNPGGVRAMPLVQVVLVLIVVGVLLWLINRFVPMAGSIKSILNAVVVIAVVLWLLNVFGLWDYASHIRVGK
jgi:hypothetical protein